MSAAVVAVGAVALLVAAYVVWLHPRMFPVFLLVTGTLYLGRGPGVAGIELSAWWLGVLILLALQTLMWLEWMSFSPPEKLYAIFLGWCAFAALRAESSMFALRVFLKLLYPFLVMLLARRALLSGEEFRGAVKWILWATFLASLLVGGFTQRFVPALCWRVGANFLWACAAFADHAAILLVLALVAWHAFRERKYLALALWLGASSVLAGIRTGVAASAVGASVFAVMALRRTAVIPVVAAIYLAAAVSLFVLPEMKAYMFYEPQLVSEEDAVLRPHTISIENIDSHGRFMMWEDVLDRFFEPDPLLGSGLGSTQAWFYAGGYGRKKVEHSSYVRLLADTGLIGCALFALTMLSCMYAAWDVYRTAASPEARFCALAAICAFPALMICMAFDNLINYTLPAGQYPFAMVGMALGMAEAEEGEGAMLPISAGGDRRASRDGTHRARPAWSDGLNERFEA